MSHAHDSPEIPSPGGGGTVAPLEREGLHRPTGRWGLGLALTLTTVAMWATLPIGLKIALQGLDPLTITWYRFSAAALFLGALLTLRGTLPPLRSLARRHWLLIAVATTCLAANYGFYVLGLHHTNASTAQVVIQIAPMLLAMGGVVVFGERFAVAQWAGFALLVTGLGLFSHGQITSMFEGLDRYYLGLVFMVAAAVSWAAYGLAQKQLLGRLSSPSIMLCIYVGAAVVFTPLAEPAGVAAMTASQAGALVFCIANMLLAYGTFSESLAHLEASRVSAVLAVVPLATLAMLRIAERTLPWLVEHEPITPAGLVGACMVVAGSLLASSARR